MNRLAHADRFRDELLLTTSRSGGPGGQNVNKVETKVTLKFDVVRSVLLSPEEKEILLRRLSTQLTRDGVLLIIAQESRSQRDNREKALEKLNTLMSWAFKKEKVRKATKPSRTAKLKRLQSKKVRSEKKKWRQKP